MAKNPGNMEYGDIPFSGTKSPGDMECGDVPFIITVSAVGVHNTQSKLAGVWTQNLKVYAKNSGAWIQCKVYVKVSGVWKEVDSGV